MNILVIVALVAILSILIAVQIGKPKAYLVSQVFVLGAFILFNARGNRYWIIWLVAAILQAAMIVVLSHQEQMEVRALPTQNQPLVGSFKIMKVYCRACGFENLVREGSVQHLCANCPRDVFTGK